MKHLIRLIIGTLWIADIVLANGVTQVIVSTIFPPYAFYLVIETAMILAEFI